MNISFEIPITDLLDQNHRDTNEELVDWVKTKGKIGGRIKGLFQRIQSCRSEFRAVHANDLSILNPIIWANEAILQLQPNMVLGNLVTRDWDNKVARFGDIVNAFLPGTFTMTRKGALCDNVVVQDASGSSIQVALNQFPQVAFLICDGEEDRNQLDLIDTLLVPAVIALAQGIDRILGAQVHQFTDQYAGHLGLLDSTTFKQYVLETRELMNRNNVPLANRALVVTPGTETAGLNLDNIMTAEKVGDGGTALATATLGEKYGFQFVMSQTQPEVVAGQTVIATTTTALTTVGATVVNVTSATGMAAGQWLTVAGDDAPHQITAINTLALTVAPALKRATPSSAAVTIVKGGLVNNSGGYIGTSLHPRVIGWAKEILLDTFTTLVNNAPQVGQMVTFGVDATRYAIIAVRIIDAAAGTYGIMLDQPLANAIADNATVNLGPVGKYNFAMLKNAFALVNRPLPQPRSGVGAISKVTSDPANKISIRVTITYDQYKQGHLVVLDTLMGVGVLNKLLGYALLG